MSKLLAAGGLAVAGLISLAGPAQAYWYPTPYYYGYHPRPVFYGPRYVPVVPYYRPRVVYSPPVYLPPPAYVAPVYPAAVYVAPVRPAPVLRRPVRAVPRPVAAPPPCACSSSEASPFAGPGRVDAATTVATLPAPLPTLGTPTLPSPAQPRTQDIPEFPAFRSD